MNEETQIELAVKARQGDQAAITLLIRKNEKFVIMVARQYAGQGMELDDLVQEGNLGLLKAIDRFNPKLGTKFLTYASWWIKQSILQALAEHNRHVRIPVNRVTILEQYKRKQAELTQDLMREPSKQEILEALNLTEHDVVTQTSVSYDAPKSSHDDSDGTILDILPNDFPSPDSALLEQSFKQELNFILNKLDTRERTIIKMIYGIGYERSYTLEEIGDQMKLTRERIRQIKQKAIQNLQRMNRRKKLNGIKD